MRCCCRCAVILWQITTLREVFHVAAEFLVVGAAEFMLIGMAALEVVHPMAEFLVVSRSFQPRSRSTGLKLAKVVCKLPLFFALRFQILSVAVEINQVLLQLCHRPETLLHIPQRLLRDGTPAQAVRERGRLRFPCARL